MQKLILVFILVVVGPVCAEEAKVIEFGGHVARRSCQQSLAGSRAGVVALYPPLTPPFEERRAFVADMEVPSDSVRYYYYSGHSADPFLDQRSPSWSMTPSLPKVGGYLYVAKVEGLVAGNEPLSGQFMRAQMKVLAFTKIPTPRIFTLLQVLVEHTRTFESQLYGVAYDPAVLDFESIRFSKSLARQSSDFLDSWQPLTVHELKIKELVRDWLLSGALLSGDDFECGELAKILADKLKRIYANALFKPESLLAELALYSRE